MIIKNRIKTIVLIFIVLGMIFIFSCGNGDSENMNISSGDEAGIKNPGAESAAEGRIPDGLPERDYENYEFGILSVDPKDVNEIPQVQVEEEIGEIINDSTYHRNMAVEERFNIRIKPIYVTWLEAPEYLRRAVNAGDTTYDLALVMQHQVGNVVVSNLLRPWNELEHVVDFDKPWWQKEANRAFNFGDTVYITTGDMCTSIFYYSNAMYFNKRMAADYGIEDIYDVVRNSKWTIDYLMNVTRNIYSEFNDGTASLENLYGFGLTCANEIDAFVAASGLSIIEQKNGELVFGINNERMINLVSKAVDLCHRPSTFINKDIWGVSRDELFRMFAADRIFITPGTFMSLINNTRDMDSDYGVLPYPMLDEKQGGYFNEPATLLATLVIPTTVQTENIERVGIITEALNREAYYTVRPAFYDVALKVKTVRDEDSEEMIDIILDGRRYDMGMAFDFSSMAYILRQLVNDNGTDFVSRFERQENSGNAALQRIQNSFQDLN